MAPQVETTARVASFLFLGGVLLVFSSVLPAVRAKFPPAFALGSFMALGSPLLVLAAALVFR